ncbi:MAG: universal stress protein [Nitrospiraceae bacterium]|nr:universal stress protein [Nitrospiraceae bacterium]
MYKNIIVAYDNSDFSKAALIEASHWVRRHGGKITLLHTVYFDEEEFSIAPDQRELRLSSGAKACTEAAGMARSEFGIETESIIREGEPHEILTAVAEEKGADLIAMGTHGRKGLKRLLMGSVTSGVIVRSKCDVLVVKRLCEECTGTYDSLVVPYDGSQFSRHALQKACRLSKMDKAKLTLLYVIPRYEEMIEFFNTDSIEKSLLKEAMVIVDGAVEIASTMNVQPEVKIEKGQAAARVVDTASTLMNPLIVMSTYGWRGVNKAVIGSTTERVIAGASCPVLVVKS